MGLDVDTWDERTDEAAAAGGRFRPPRVAPANRAQQPAGWLGRAARGIRESHGRVRTGHTVLFARHLATLLGAGLPIAKALRTVARQVDHPRLSAIVHGLADQVEAGEMLSSAMAHRSEVFDTMMINVVRAGEAGGKLPDTLEQLAHDLEKKEALRRTVLAAMVYPTIVIVVATGVVGFLLTFVVPTFESVYAKMHLELPLITKSLLWTSRAAVQWWWVPMALVASLTVSWKPLKNVQGFRRWWDSLVLQVPLLGKPRRKALTSRFLGAFATLTGSGVSIVESLRLMVNLTDNTVVRDAISDIRRHVSRGGKMSNPMERYAGLFSPMAIQMISVGEETGSLPEATARTADFLAQEVEARVKTLVTLIEPLMTVALGMLVGTIVLAIYLPMFDLMQHVSR